MNEYNEQLKQIPIFKNISDFEMKNILTEIHIYKKEYKEGSVILLQGNAYNDLYIIIKGSCYSEMVDISGKIVKIEDFASPFALAPGFLFADKNILPVSVAAKTETVILVISKNDILKLCALSKTFLKNFLTDISDKLVFISTKVSFFQFKSIKEKFANYIISLPKDSNNEITLPISIEELSNLFGVSRPSLSRVISELEDEKVIERKNKKIKIIDIEKLTYF